MAKLSQLMAVCYDGWEPIWEDNTQPKYGIYRNDDRLHEQVLYTCYSFLAFKSSKLRDEFFKNFEEDIRLFFEMAP